MFDSKKKVQQGFTLVEMAIVLAIIGVILGAVSVGKDLQRDAENQKIYQKFISGWKQAYDIYYSRTGVILGDSQIAPTYMVNGNETTVGGGVGTGAAGNTTASGGAGGPGIPGDPTSGFANTGLRICEGTGLVAAIGDPGLAIQNLHALFDQTGIRMPPGRTEGQEDRYLYLDSNGNPAELQVCFQWNPNGTASGAGNVMVVRGLTPDLARTLDQMVDGKPDATEGRFRQQSILAPAGPGAAGGVPGVQWVGDNTIEVTQGAVAQGTGSNQDEDRVILLTAHWVMDQ